MPDNGQSPSGVHLVGSVPLSNSEEVFRTAATILGRRLRRLPDGETGIRDNWINWQHAIMAATPQFEALPPDPAQYAFQPRVRLREKLPAEQVQFGSLEYARVARESYDVFKQLKSQGIIPDSVRFQVSLPTPLAPVIVFVVPEDQAATEPAYEKQLLAELDEIARSIPHDELAIQWDVAVEFAMLEGVFPSHLQNLQADIIERLIRVGEAVPADIEMGYHLCYGDAGHQHFVQPKDTSRLVEIANALSAGVKRTIEFIHLPVPRNRSDEAYFEPLKDLKLKPETELYLGLVHYTDGLEGTQRRIETASRVVGSFGVATECGMGRRKPETIEPLLRIHAEVAAPVS